MDSERRSPRLTSKSVEVRITDPASEILAEGLTTGLNENGLGGRFRLNEGKRLVAGEGVRILFRHSAISIPPVEGTVVRVEPSWVPSFDLFAAFRFEGLPEEDINLLKDYVKYMEKRDESPDRVQRMWYVWYQEKEYGPLTANEVRSAIEKGNLTLDDKVYLGAAAEWVPISQVPLLVRGLSLPAAEGEKIPGDEGALKEPASRAAEEGRGLGRIAAAIVLVIIIGGGLLGWREYEKRRNLGALLDSARAYSSAGYREEALGIYDEYLSLADDRSAADERASLASEISSRREALEAREARLRGIIDERPGLPQAWNDLAVTLASLGRDEEALDALSEAGSAAPEAYYVPYNRGTILLTAGRPGEALRELERAYRLAPGRSDLLFNLGLAAARSGDVGADRYWDEAARIAADDPAMTERIEYARAYE